MLVNNAAIPKRRAVTALDPPRSRPSCAVNFFAPMRLTLAVLPRMLARGAGMIVNVSSVGGRLGIIHESAYSASKFALCGWSESMAVDLHGTGVSVKLIEPGPVDTEIWDQPGNDDPIYDGPKFSADEVAAGHHRGAGRRPLRALRARHEGGRRLQERRHRHLHRRAAAGHGEAGLVRALVFGVPPEPFEVPDDANPLDPQPGPVARRLQDVPDPDRCTTIGWSPGRG